MRPLLAFGSAKVRAKSNRKKNTAPDVVDMSTTLELERKWGKMKADPLSVDLTFWGKGVVTVWGAKIYLEERARLLSFYANKIK